MSGYRVTGGICALVLAALLAYVAVISFGPEDIVAPSVRITEAQRTTAGQAGATKESPTTASVLAARTRLLDDRRTSGPDAFPPLSGGSQSFVMRPGVPNGTQLAKTWEQHSPPAGILTGDQLRVSGNIVGDSSLPYNNAKRLQQPGGRDWRRAHNDQVRYGGGWLIFGTALALALFLFARGRIPVAEGFSGQTIERFIAIERANHWMTASGFVLLALTGLVLIYGKPLLLPLMGEPAFRTLAWWSVWLHMASAIPFILGIVIMIGLWLLDNLPTSLDWNWLKQGGGFLRDEGPHPPARKFNAGQKIVFWGVVLGGLAMLATGITLMFPFYWFGYDGMQATQISHAAIALLMFALILGHIYIGTIGMEGAFDAMWSGRVDRNWAKEHHSIWYREKVEGKRQSPNHPRQASVPAE
jgi:formate dehydrogenase subunit gamma